MTRYWTEEGRMAALDEQVAELYADEAIDEATVKALLVGNRLAAPSKDRTDEQRALLRALPPEATWQDWVVVATYALYSPDQRWSLIRALGLGAKWWELLAIGVSGLNVEGEDLQSISTPVLHERMKAVQQLKAEAQPSEWLARYAARLVAESKRRRRGATA